MFGASLSSYQSSNFDFSMKTSSGDKIDLSMYSNKESEFSMLKSDGLEAMSLSIKEEYGYSFSYKGDGIDAQDAKEIKEALKKIEPLLKIFQNNNPNQIKESATNLAFDINSLLPTPKDENHKNFIKDETLNKFDQMLKAFESAENMREFAKSVFDRLEEQMQGLRLYV